MDSYHHHQRYIRPPQPPPVPPPSSDPHHYLHHQSRPPLPPQPTWYPNQFHYNPPQPQPPSSHSPSPPPPQQWAALPQSDHHAPPPPPPPNPYPSYHPQPGHQFPPLPPRPHLPAPPHSQIPQSYPQGNQEWANQNWGQHQGWDYQGAHNNVEDWAARARAWAAQNASTDGQNHQSQFPQASRMEEQIRYHDQYQQNADSHYQDFQQQPYHGSGYQQFPVSAAPSQQPIVYQQENASLSSGQYSNDGLGSYTVGGGSSVGAPTTSSSVLPQEVPSSYSSVTGNEEASVHMDQPYKSLPLPSSAQEGQHHVQQPLSALGGPVPTEQPFSYSNQRADITVDLSNQPLQFASNFSHDHDPHMQTNYGIHHDSSGSVRGHGPVPPLPSVNSWAPAVANSGVYPPIPSGLSLGHQHDPSLASPSVSGHAAPPFGSFPGTSFQPTIPAAGAPYGLGSGGTVLPSTGFPGDAYGINSASERPKKASVPNWLKEEIIKNASVITKSSLEHPKEDTQSIEDEGVEKSSGKGDQEDSKSIDSSRSTEEEDEDDVEADRTVAINQEIKRILTEVLLKVTDQLFDEIATKVLNEDDPTDEVDHNTVTLNDKIPPSPPEVPTPKASAKVLVPLRTKESDNEDISEKSSSSVPGNVLGLANYASDDDEDDYDGEIKSSTVTNSKENNVLQQSSTAKVEERVYDENGNSAVDLEMEHIKNSKESISKANVGGSIISQTSNGSMSKPTFGENASENPQVKDTKTNLHENQHEQKRNYSGKEKDSKEAERRSQADEKGDGNHRKHDEKHSRKEKIDDRNSAKEKTKVRSDGTGEKAKESDSRKKSSQIDAKDRKESERRHRSSGKDDDDRKRGRGKDKEEDRATHRLSSDSSKHKRRRSSSTSSKGQNSKDSYSSDESSDGSKRRRVHSRRRNLSPSPVRSRRRQVSRSPHSKHSQRRHSPYSSLESSRSRRSGSKSPVRRRR